MNETYNKLCFLDIETTGLSVSTDEIVEIGIIKITNIGTSDETTFIYHSYINPSNSLYMDPKVFAIHGLSLEFLRDKPVIGDILDDIVAFVEDIPIVIHNMGFD